MYLSFSRVHTHLPGPEKHTHLPVPGKQSSAVAEIQLQLDIGTDVPVDGDEDGFVLRRHGRAGAAHNALWW